ncbi:hypothetical protein VNI00_000113 [Paramarasmius palmivorus]|uniref:UBC core domain-containing protein n=1 Tax=Paramarasmius palmivorus TaxID=297713 RepID=A0AAW0EF14_9AGAR
MPPALSNPMTMKRIHREIADLKKEDLGALTLSPTEDSLFLWKGTIPGPEGSVYEGGVFNLDVMLAPDYPLSLGQIYCTESNVQDQNIPHECKTAQLLPAHDYGVKILQISDRGDICIDILKQNWSPALSLFKVMLSLSSLLTDPNPRDPLVSSIANQYVSNRKLHDDTARQWTTLYAKPKPAPATQKPSSKALGKAKASMSSIPSGSRQPVVPDSSSVPIEIDDSDDESSTKASVRPTVGTKRKREARGEDGQTVDSDGEDDDVVLTGPSSSRKTASRGSGSRTAASGSGRRVAPRLSTEVIVIEDD